MGVFTLLRGQWTAMSPPIQRLTADQRKLHEQGNQDKRIPVAREQTAIKMVTISALTLIRIIMECHIGILNDIECHAFHTFLLLVENVTKVHALYMYMYISICFFILIHP